NDDEGEERPPWHWAVIGAVATLLAATPLGMLAAWAARAALEGRTAAVGLERIGMALLAVGGPLLALAVGALLGGLLVGRFGGAAGTKEATAGGLGAGAVVALVAAYDAIARANVAGWLFSAMVVLIVAALFARLGAWVGLRKRR